MTNRRSFMQRALALGTGLVGVPLFSQSHKNHGESGPAAELETRRSAAARPPVMVVTPDIPDLPFRLVDGVKEFHLIAEPVKREIVPGRMMDVWGYNGSCPGPTIQVTQGDRVRIILDNHLPEATTMHWHGFEIPNQMDGMPYISQQPILPGGRYVYEFTLHQQGTFFYHSHGAMQEMLGMIGMFIMHPRQAHEPNADHDFGVLMQEWAILPNNTVPNSAMMEFNWLTFNGKAGPAITPLLVRHGSRVRIRLVNLGMDHHPIHLHGYTFVVTGTEAGRQPQALWGPSNTVLVGVAQARDIEFVANNPGDWMIHCHLPHHMMNAMSDLMGERATLTGERAASTSALSPEQAKKQTANSGMQMEKAHDLESSDSIGSSENENAVPGFPQDAFMEMSMDEMVQKPETFGLPKNWSAGLQGMNMLLRVLSPDMYDKILAMKERNSSSPKHDKNDNQHQHG